MQPRRTQSLRTVDLALLLVVLLVTLCPAQQADRRQTARGAEKAAGKGSESTTAPGPDSLIQLNAALESLAGKVSRAVVQITVTGYGPLEENDTTEAALIGRQRAIGSGVIVGPGIGLYHGRRDSRDQ